jgi:hypothetical protein
VDHTLSKSKKGSSPIWIRAIYTIFLAVFLPVSLSIFLVEISFGISLQGDSVREKDTKGTLLWRTNLSSMGLRSKWPDLHSRHFMPRSEYDLVTFLDDHVLAVSFPVYEGRRPPARRIFRVILLDVKTGSVIRTKQWLVLARELGFQATRQRNFAVHSRQNLELYTQAFDKIAEFPLPDTRRPLDWEDWQVHATPNRERIVVKHFLDRELTLYWLNSQTLVPERIWKAPTGEFGLGANKDKAKILDASSSGIVAVPDWSLRVSSEALGADCHIFVAHGDKPLEGIAIQHAACSLPPSAAGAQWVDEKILFLPTRNGLVFLDANGRELLAHAVGEKESAYHGRTSLNGQRYVVPIVAWKGGVELLDIGSHMFLKRLLLFEISGMPEVKLHSIARINTNGVSGFAISTEGTRLAMVRNSVVEMHFLQ